MKKVLLFILVISANASFAQYTEWHVSTNGTSGGFGTAASPWDLQTALNKPNTIVKPGDTVWLHGGTYTGRFTSTLIGSSTDYITVSSYPGEWAILNGNLTNVTTDPPPIICPLNSQPETEPETEVIMETHTIREDLSTYQDDDELNINPVLGISGGYVIFKDFEVNFTGNYVRTLYDTNPTAFHKITGINHVPNTAAKKSKFVNLIVKNIPGTGFGSWKTAADSEIYGCIIYHNGYIWFNSNTTVDDSFQIKGKGPGIYTQNNSDDINNPRLIKNNIVHNNYDSGVLVWSASTNPSSDYIKNFELRDNILFNNGNPGRRRESKNPTNTDNPTATEFDSKSNLVIASDSGNQFNHPTNINVHNNVFYLNSLNYISGANVWNTNNVNIHDNVISKGTKGCSFSINNTNLSLTDNIYWGKQMFVGATVASYTTNNWNINNNKYYTWEFNSDQMFHIPHPTIDTLRIKVPYSDFKLRYTTAETGTNSTYQETYGGYGVMGFIGQPSDHPHYFASQIKVTQNEYNPNLFYVTLFNTRGFFEPVTSLPVSFSSYNIANGRQYVIRDVQNYPVISAPATYNGSPINLSVTSTETERPNGYYEDVTCPGNPWRSQFSRKRDFAVYTIEFLPCNGISYDTTIANTSHNSIISVEAKGHVKLGENYYALNRANVTANAGKEILLTGSSHLRPGSKVHLKIDDPCPDLAYVGEGTSSKMISSNNGEETIIKEAKQREELFFVYPNPNSGIFKLEGKKDLKIKAVIIRDINSARIILQEKYSSENIINIDISNVKEGLYTIQVTFDDNSTSSKTIIKK